MQNNQLQVAILCAAKKSNYFHIPDLDIYDESRDAFTYTGGVPVIAHPPCAQWSRMKAFANYNKRHLELAAFCIDAVRSNGGILEHPAGSSIFRHFGLSTAHIISVSQSWWGFPAQKRTYLYFHECKPCVPHPLSFDCITGNVSKMNASKRSLMPLSFCQWLCDCVRASYKGYLPD